MTGPLIESIAFIEAGRDITTNEWFVFELLEKDLKGCFKNSVM
jgi:hypothetical protein